jgi:hypothetical protein
MALTDADRLHMVAMALMRHSVFTTGGGTPSTGLETFNMFGLIQLEDAELTLITLSAL